MQSGQQLAKRLREVILNGTWIANTNFKNELEHVDWQLANTKVGNLNSIAILAQHIHYYIAGINEFFINGTLEIRDKYSFDFPPIASQMAWEAFQSRFWIDTETLALHIEALSSADLERDFVDPKYGNYLRNIDGLIEHSYYHLGQLVLVKKMVLLGS